MIANGAGSPSPLVIPAEAGIQCLKIPPPAGTPFRKGRIIVIPPFLKEVSRSYLEWLIVNLKKSGFALENRTRSEEM